MASYVQIPPPLIGPLSIPMSKSLWTNIAQIFSKNLYLRIESCSTVQKYSPKHNSIFTPLIVGQYFIIESRPISEYYKVLLIIMYY